MDDLHSRSLPKMYPKPRPLITSIAVLESRWGGENRSKGLTHLQVAPFHQFWSMLGEKDGCTMCCLLCREIILSESFSPVLNQNTLTLRGKINEKHTLPNFYLSIFLVRKLLFPPTELFESNANRVFLGLGLFFDVTGFVAKPVLKCSCVKWHDSWCCGYGQRIKWREEGEGRRGHGRVEEWRVT